MKNMKRWASALLAMCMLLMAAPAPAEPAGAPTPAAEQSAEPTAAFVEGSGEPTLAPSADPSASATASLAPSDAVETASPVPSDAVETASPVPSDVTETVTPAPSDAAETVTPAPSDVVAEGTPEPEASASAEATASASPSPEATEEPALMENTALAAPKGAMVNNGTMSGTGTWGLDIENNGLITAGNYTQTVYNSATGEITGGNFTGKLENYGSVTGAYLDCEIVNRGTITGCTFGPNARVTGGTFTLTVTVNGESKTVNHDDKIAETLGGGTWCRVNGSSFSICGADETFGLQPASYVSLSAPVASIDYEAETVTVTAPSALAGLTAEDELCLCFSLDVLISWEEWNDAFANGGSYTNTLEAINSFNQMFTGNALPRDAGGGDVEVPVCFGLPNGSAYAGAQITLTVPERPECGLVDPLALSVDAGQLGVDSSLCGAYDFGVAPAGDPAPDEPSILDEDGDGLITGLDVGGEYVVFLRLKATDSSFRSAWRAQGSAVAAVTYTVTYTDGVDGEEVFADQITENLLEGEATPAFEGTPSREGYAFVGWEPEVAATVSGDATYAATWKETAEDEETEPDPAEIAEKLAAGEAVDGLVTDRYGAAMPYDASTEEAPDEAAQGTLLAIAADPVLDEDGQPVLRDGEPVYEQRNLNLSRGLLDALAELGYTHIRFAVKDAALEWRIADMTEDGSVVRLAPMGADERSQAEIEAMDGAEALTDSYRARVTAMVEGEETDVTSAIPSLTAVFDAESVRALAEGEAAQLLLVPNDGEPETVVSAAEYAEAKARYEAPLAESGLFALTAQ